MSTRDLQDAVITMRDENGIEREIGRAQSFSYEPIYELGGIHPEYVPIRTTTISNRNGTTMEQSSSVTDTTINILPHTANEDFVVNTDNLYTVPSILTDPFGKLRDIDNLVEDFLEELKENNEVDLKSVISKLIEIQEVINEE